ncbi:hypothetical protein QYF36_006670 [Acer negundo]|nr:hypothetical protein QYF36_006670 [Acer negundo]
MEIDLPIEPFSGSLNKAKRAITFFGQIFQPFHAKPVARQKPLAKARLNIERSPSGLGCTKSEKVGRVSPKPSYS